MNEGGKVTAVERKRRGAGLEPQSGDNTPVIVNDDRFTRRILLLTGDLRRL